VFVDALPQFYNGLFADEQEKTQFALYLLRQKTDEEKVKAITSKVW